MSKLLLRKYNEYSKLIYNLTILIKKFTLQNNKIDTTFQFRSLSFAYYRNSNHFKNVLLRKQR